MSNPTAAMITIGDEILAGRTADANMPHLAKALTVKGIRLAEARVVPDIAENIIRTVNELRSAYTHVFTSGGIGPTHDDITADCIAEAFGVGIDVRADARAVLATNYANAEMDLNESRLRMARIPDGATLIENPVSKAPGFSIGNVHVMAGVPSVFRAMVACLLPELSDGNPVTTENMRIGMPEGDLAGPLRDIAGAHQNVSIGCYPFSLDGKYGANLVVTGANAGEVATAVSALRRVLGDKELPTG